MKIRNLKHVKKALGEFRGSRKRTVELKVVGSLSEVPPRDPADNGGGTFYNRKLVGANFIVEECVFCGQIVPARVFATVRGVATSLFPSLPEILPHLTPEQQVELDSWLEGVR